MSRVESTLELLRERFPKCFVRYPQPRQPLKIGVHKDLAVQHPRDDWIEPA